MNLNLDNLGSFVLSKLLFVAANFIDDLCCLLLSHLGIHLPWLQILSFILISSKIIYAIYKLSISWYRRKLQNA
ncbi:hypothetical protein IQ255_09775 [Pleurocapsales cyanobacterium LEGE 10410]|nr:hypothetical protein [Pleurocapsales cyanobacterium LEGE 10410]